MLHFHTEVKCAHTCNLHVHVPVKLDVTGNMLYMHIHRIFNTNRLIRSPGMNSSNSGKCRLTCSRHPQTFIHVALVDFLTFNSTLSIDTARSQDTACVPPKITHRHNIRVNHIKIRILSYRIMTRSIPITSSPHQAHSAHSLQSRRPR